MQAEARKNAEKLTNVNTCLLLLFLFSSPSSSFSILSSFFFLLLLVLFVRAVGFGSAAVGLFWVDMRDKFEEILRDRGDAAATVEVGNAAIVFFAGVILSIFLLFYSIGSLCYFTKYQ